MKNRREFLQKSVLGIAGVLTAPTWLQGAPALIKSLGRPNSLINGVQIGCITYSFRSMADQSAEATLNRATWTLAVLFMGLTVFLSSEKIMNIFT